MLAVDTGSEQERRRLRRSCYTATFALAGFLDIALSSRFFTDLSFARSVMWGVVGAGAYAVAYLALSVTSEMFGDDPEGDAAAQLNHDEQSDDDDDDDDGGQDTWLARAGWFLALCAIVAVSTTWLFIMFNAKSIFVIACFAAWAPQPSAWAFLAVVAISGTIQLVAMNTVVIPIAKRRGISL